MPNCWAQYRGDGLRENTPTEDSILIQNKWYADTCNGGVNPCKAFVRPVVSPTTP